MTHVAITGASSGIGEALARELLQAGAAVTLIARRRERLEALARTAGGRSQVIACDLGDVAHALDWIAPAEAELGPIDVLVNNAGVMQVVRTVDIDPTRARAELELDLWVPLALCRAVLPAMLARKSGTLVQISSVAALAPTPGMSHYNAAKAGLAAYSESLRGELRGSGVNVLTVYPGPVATALEQNSRAAYDPRDMGLASRLPVGKPEVLARRIRRGIERQRARIIYPRFYTLTRYFPTITRWLLDRASPTPRPLLPEAR
jgi:short-subunit dehydrogenase